LATKTLLIATSKPYSASTPGCILYRILVRMTTVRATMIAPINYTIKVISTARAILLDVIPKIRRNKLTHSIKKLNKGKNQLEICSMERIKKLLVSMLMIYID
jgi:hypothetical protein